MYLRGDAVRALIDSIRQLSAPGSVFAFTFMKTETDQRDPFSKTNEAGRLVVALARRAFSVGIVA